MEQRSDEEASENQSANSPSKQGNARPKSGDGARGEQSDVSPSKSESNGEAEKSEQTSETPTTSSDKRKLETQEQKYTTFTAAGASQESVEVSPTKRKCTERHFMASEKFEPEEDELEEDEPEYGTSAADTLMQDSRKRPLMLPISSASGFVMQGSPKRSPAISETSVVDLSKKSPDHPAMIPGTSAADVVTQGSSKRSPTMPRASETSFVMQRSPKRSPTSGTSEAGLVMQGSPNRSPTIPRFSTGAVVHGSPMRSPTKRTYKERHQSSSVDELEEKRLKEESGYQSDSALDLRKDQFDSALDLRTDFKKQMASSTQLPDPQPTSSDKMEVVGNQPESKYATQSSFPRDTSASSEVTSSDGGEADVSSTSHESVKSTTGEAASSTHSRQAQNTAEANTSNQSPKTSPQRSGARPKEATSSRSRPLELVSISYPTFSPSSMFYADPTIRVIDPSSAGSSGHFKVPPPPPPPEDRPVRITNAYEKMQSMIEDCHAIVSAELAAKQWRRDEELKQKRRQEEAEAFAKAKLKAAETTEKLKEKERLKSAKKLASADSKTGISAESAVAGPSYSRGRTGRRPEENVEAEVSVDKSASAELKEETVSTGSTVGRGNLPATYQSIHDENANIMEGTSSISGREDENANKSETAAKPSTSGTAAQGSQEITMNPEYLSLQQLVPQIREISLDDSLENIADPELDEDDVDIQNI